MKAEEVSFRHVVELLRSGNVSTLVESGKITRQATVRKLEAPVDYSADDQKLLQQIVGYYQERLKEAPAALKYLESRGIHYPEALAQFKIGFADRTLGSRLPHKNRKEGAEIRTRFERIGIYRDTGHEHFNGAVVFPVMDEHGCITEMYGRKINNGIRKGTAYHLYLPGSHRGIWNPSSLAAKEIILCESIIDALSFRVNGFRNVTAAYGVSGFTDEMLAAFIDKQVQKVFIAYDRDEAGDSAAAKLAEKLNGEGIETLRIQFPHKMDANEYALQVKPANKSLNVLINGATWLGKRTNQPVENAEPSPLAAPAAEPAEQTPPPEPQQTPVKEKVNVPTKIRGEDIEITLGERRYRIRGMQKNLSFDVMKVNVRVSQAEKYFIDTLDLYNARHRTALVNAAADELEINGDIIKRDVGRVLLKLEELQEDNINDTLKPQQPTVRLTDSERAEALALQRQKPAWPHSLGCAGLRHRGRKAQRSDRLFSRRLPQTRPAAWGNRAKLIGRGKIFAHGCGSCVHAA